MSVDMNKIKTLRESTGAGIMDCKQALQECDGDLSAANDLLRKKGLAAAIKRADRVAAEGLVAVAVKNKKGAILELNSETDFVSRNEKFQTLTKNLIAIALENGVSDVETFLELPAGSIFSGTIRDYINDNSSVIGEKLTLSKLALIEAQNAIFGSYIHSAITNGIGRIGVIVALESESSDEKIQELANKLAMHIAAAKPKFLKKEDVDNAILEKEKAILTEQVLSAPGQPKPEAIITKTVEGRLKKFLEEIVLLEQVSILDNKTKITDMIKETADKVGADVKVKSFIKYEIGEKND